MGKPITISILANARNAIAGVRNTTKELTVLQKTTGATGKLIAAGLAGSSVALGAFAVKGVKAASDLNETINKSNAIFGKNAGEISKWANGSARNLGLSKAAALDSAAGFGDMFLQLGLTGDAATKLSKSTVGMAADFGSFNNLPTADVAERISAAYRGEYDSLQALIPNINAARVEQEALSKTHKKSAKDLTAADKALAVNAILQKDGARAMGDFAKTSDGAANKQKILAAQFENVSAKVGQALLPAFSLALTGVEKLIGFIEKSVVPAFQKFAPSADEIRTALEKVQDVAGKVFETLKGAITPLIPSVDQVKGAFSTFVAVLQNPVFQTFAVAIAAMVAAYKVYATTMAAAAVVQGVFNAVMAANPIGLVVLAVVGLVAALAFLQVKFNIFGRLWAAIWGAIKAVVGAAVAVISAYIKAYVAVVQAVWNAIKASANAVWNAIKAVVRAVVAAITAYINAYKAVVSAVWNAIRAAASAAWNGIKAVVVGAVNAVKSVIASVQAKAAAVWSAIRSGATTAFNAVKSAVGDAVRTVIAKVGEIKAKVLAAVSGFGSLLRDAGARLIGGLVAGIKSKIGDISSAMSGIAGKVKGFLPGSPIKEGPLKSWNNGGAGIRLMGLLASGIKKGAPKVASALKASLRSENLAGLFEGASAFMAGFKTEVSPIVQAGLDLNEKIAAGVTAYAKDAKAADDKTAAARQNLTKVQTKYRQTMADTARAESRAAAETAKARKAVDNAKGAKAKAAAAANLRKAQQREADLIRNDNRKQLSAKQSLEAALTKVDKATAARAKLQLSNGILANPKAAKALQAYVAAQTKQLQKLSDLQDETSKSLDDATARLAEAVQARETFADSISDALAKSGSILSLDKVKLDEDTEGQTTANIVEQFRKRLTAARDFAAGILGLKAKGLNQSLITELASGGVQGAGETVAALLTASPADLAAINSSQQQIVSAGQELGKALASTYYDSGVSNAQALVDGLKSKQAEIEATMRALAKAANDAYTGALTTGKAPSAKAALATAVQPRSAPASNSTLTIKGDPGPQARQIIQALKDHIKDNGPISGVVFAS
jgi:phage-related protein